MAVKKAELLEEAKKLGLDVTDKSTVAQINEALASVKKSDKAPEAEEVVSENTTEEITDTKEAKTTKAGKRSEKALKEAEAKAEKEARKEAGDTTPQSDEAEAKSNKGPKPVTRTRLERRGKNYRKAAELIEVGRLYSLEEALELATKTNVGKADGTIEVHVGLNVDPRQADQNIRSTVSLPNGTGKEVRVAVFAPVDEHKVARAAGADIVGEEDFLNQLEKNVLDFDILIATPAFMPKLGKFARVLGPRGLMPNPKSGTVATDVAKAVKEAKAGRVEYRVDKQAILHLGIGKTSFGKDKLVENGKVFFANLSSNKPSSLKGSFIKSVAIATTMGPSIRVDISSL
jgi:large subunit ribosomal protein L1